MLGARGWLLLGSLALCVAVAEGVLRIAWTNPYRSEREHVVRVRRHPPGKSRIYDRSSIDASAPRVELATDARGYLLPPPANAAAPVTVVFLGGSTTECTALDPDRRFPVLVESDLRARGLDVATRNGAVSGNNVHDTLHVLLDHVVLDAPDLVVVMHATNDTGVLATPLGYLPSMGEPLDAGVAALWAKQLASRSSFLFALVRDRLAGVAFAARPLAADVAAREHGARAHAIPSAPFEQRLRALVGVARGFAIEPVLMTQPLATTRTALTPGWADAGAQARFNDAIRRVARETRTRLVDLDAAVRASGPDWDAPMHLFYDGMHVTSEGARLYARAIADALAPAVAERLSRRDLPSSAPAPAGP